MKIYTTTKDIIAQTQFQDPQLRHITKKVLYHLLQSSKGIRVLDIGCGVGRIGVLAAQHGFLVTGFDREKKAIAMANQYAVSKGVEKNVIFKVSDIATFKKNPLTRQAFDAVICSEVIEHVQNPQEIVALAQSVLKKNGICVFTTPHDPALWSPMDEYAEHVRRFTYSEIRQLFSHFTVLNIYTIGFPIMRFVFKLFTILQLMKNRPYDPSWRQAGILNLVYDKAMQGALRFDDVFNSFQRGTTWIIVARKKG